MSTQDPAPSTADRLVTAVRVLVTMVLGGIGAAAGFTHTHDWAAHHGQTGWLAWADAIVIEGIAIVAGFEVQHDHRTGATGKVTFPLLVLVAGFGVQMAAQVALAEPTPAGWLVAAMPALGFLVVVKLLMRRTPEAESAAPRSPAAPVPPPAESAPALNGRRPAPSSVLSKLPAGIRKTITAATEDAHTAGRQVTPDDLTARVTLPDAMVTALVTELNTAVNHHPATA
ncbi:MAG: hypothetical protein JWQ81_6074 [Amycolatopsis sp.]|uniref:DUF2637 domain-containing protein n=1 Tax=Amycolatopsis sp. TaxID=37632 RepID=UPI0026296F75|nr:DUF2637 domain-containing protein [Amycolatopsis sp.]MCU1685335.1 hypothetical protein [Amycolatopsis sp.]